MSKCDLADLIKHSDLKKEVMYRSGGTNDIVKVIAHADSMSLQWVNQDTVECLLGNTEYETLRNVWTVVKRNLKYRPDLPGHEVVKSPGALVTMGVGDCKSFSILIGAILKSLGFKYVYRFSAYEKGDVTHVYPVAFLNGKEVILDAVHSRFDEEVTYYRKQDMRPGGNAQGIRQKPTQPFAEGANNNLITWAAGLFLVWALFK